jgi:WD40 repeat protein
MKLIFYLLLIYLSYSCTGRLRPVQPVYNDSINQQLWSADWSPDNKFIAVGGVDSMVRIYHAHNLRLYKSFFIPSWIHVVKWNRDGSLLAIATSTDYVHVLDMHSGLLRKLDNYPHGSDNSGNGSRAMGWNYTGDMLAVGGLDGLTWHWTGIRIKIFLLPVILKFKYMTVPYRS